MPKLRLALLGIAVAVLGLVVYSRAQDSGFKGPVPPRRAPGLLYLRVEGVPAGTPVTIVTIHPDTGWFISGRDRYVVADEPWQSSHPIGDADAAVYVECPTLQMCGTLDRVRPSEAPQTVRLRPGRPLSARVARGPEGEHLVVALFGRGFLGLTGVDDEGRVSCIVPRVPVTMLAHNLAGDGNQMLGRSVLPEQSLLMSGESADGERVRLERRPNVFVSVDIESEAAREDRSHPVVWAEQGNVRLHGIMAMEDLFTLWEGPWTLHARAVRADGVRLRGSVSFTVDVNNSAGTRLTLSLGIDP